MGDSWPDLPTFDLFRPCPQIGIVREGVLKVVDIAPLKLPSYMNEQLTYHNLHLAQGRARRALLHVRVLHPTKLRVDP